MHIHHILVGSDLSPSSARSHAPVTALAQKLGARVSLIHVDEWVDFGLFPSQEVLGYQRAHKERVSAELDREARQLEEGGLDVDVIAREGRPSREILDYVQGSDVDLLVITRHRHRKLRHALMGSNATRLIRHLHVPTLVVPGGEDEPVFRGFHQVLTTTDYSEDSARGLALAVGLAHRFRAGITLTHTYAMPPLYSALPAEPGVELPLPSEALFREHHEAALSKIVEGADGQDLDWLVVANPSIAGGIVHAAEKVGADLIVIPSHGKGTVRATLLGSTSEQVLHLSHVPVLVVPRDYLRARTESEGDA